MTTESASGSALDPTQAARIERLAARRDRRNSTVPGEALPPPSVARSSTARDDVDAALAARLDRLSAARVGRDQAPPAGRSPAPAKRRRHPAKHSRTAALALSVLASGGLGFWFSRTDPAATAAPAAPVGVVPATTSATPETATTNATSATPTTSNSVDTPVATTPAPTTAATVPAEPITVNGQSFHNEFGDVQVQATFAADGSITAVDAVQVPYRDGKSVRINGVAVPRLNSEALSAQSANIDTVSGATYTSIGYEQSLQSAIDLAVANGIPVASGTA